MRLIQITDCHLMADTTKCVYGDINPYQTLAQCLRLSNDLAPDAIIFTGDISGDNTAQSYRHFIALYTKYCSSVATKVIAGNHDVNPYFAEMLGSLLLQAGEPWRLKHWLLHGLDSTFEGARGLVGTAQMEQVAQAVADNRDHFHLAAVHHHPVDSESWMDRHCLTDAAALRQWFASNQAIRGLIHGHIHTARECYIAQRPIWSSPSSCWQWAMTPEFGLDDAAPGVRVVDLAPDGTITTFIRRVA